jgi:hypothetical protein
MHAGRRTEASKRSLRQTPCSISSPHSKYAAFSRHASAWSKSPLGMSPVSGRRPFLRRCLRRLRDPARFPESEHFEGNRPLKAAALRAGHSVISDLRRSPSLRMTSPIHSVHFHVPQAQLDAIAGDAGIRVGSQLAFTPGAAIDDPVLRGLASLLLPAFQRPAEANRLFVDDNTLAAGAHVARAYGGVDAPARRRAGGLTAWQVRRATDLLMAHPNGDLAVDDVARVCGLSSRTFLALFSADHRHGAASVVAAPSRRNSEGFDACLGAVTLGNR